MWRFDESKIYSIGSKREDIFEKMNGYTKWGQSELTGEQTYAFIISLTLWSFFSPGSVHIEIN